MKPFDLDKFKSRQSKLDPALSKIEHVVEEGQTYAIRNGRRFKIGILNPNSTPPKAKHKEFKPKFVQVPLHWVEKLERTPNGNTYRLAHRILLEAFQRERMGGEIVLSAEMTGMVRTVRHRAAKELEQLDLIKLSREGNHALKVILI